MLTLQRAAKRNALTRELIEQFSEALQQLHSADVRLLVVQAEGPVFCAGMDLGQMQQRAEQPDADREYLQDSRVYADLLKSLYQFPAPTLAVVQGPALAGGMGIVLACDLVVASHEAFFALPEPQRGITAAMVTPLLVYRLGIGRASSLLLSGRRTSATELAGILCHAVVPGDRLAATRDEWIESICTGSLTALRITKQHLQRCAGRPIEDLIDYSIEVSATARETADAREGLAAFAERRKPNWQRG